MIYLSGFFLVLILSLALRAVESDDLPWLKVRAIDKTLNPNSLRDFVICDEYGREVTLRGACIEAEQRRCVISCAFGGPRGARQRKCWHFLTAAALPFPPTQCGPLFAAL